MSDFLVDLGANKRARKAIQALGLPIPLPQKLRRTTSPWEARPLEDLPVVVGLSENAALGSVLAGTLARAGANAYVVGDEDALPPFALEGEVRARPPKLLPPGEAERGLKPHALVFDATGISTPEGLRAVYEVFHPWIRSLARCGRIVLLGRPASNAQAPEAAAGPTR